ncbi:MAG TPA: hypothetical protein VMP01_00585 [Pirellulaceae bacterium]|nr:hypothetical protein [Pirellulaceae bacterium]
MRFTIRDLLWLTVVVALGVAWWVDRSSLAALVDELANREFVETFIDRFDRLRNSSAPAPNLPSD